MSMTRVGGYDVLRRLGAGGMGEVLLARDPRLERNVAIKVLRADFAVDPLARKRFHREAKALASLRHPGVVTIFEIGEDMGLDFIVMEFLEGSNLRAHMSRTTLSQTRIVELAVQIGSAIVGAHGAGVLHRDIKPENIMVLDDDTIRVVDFGLARSFDEVEPVKTPNPDAVVDLMGDTLDAEALGRANTESDEVPVRPAAKTPRLTAVTETILGTPAYMAPELFLGEAPTAATDVYSFGVLLYEMFSGSLPFPASNLNELLADRVHGDREPDPLTAGQYATDEMSDFVQGLLSKDPSERPSIEHCVETLEAMTGAVTEKVRPLPAELRSATPSLSHEIDVGAARRGRRQGQALRMALGALVLVSAAAVALFFVASKGKDEDKETVQTPAIKSKSIAVAIKPFESHYAGYAHAGGAVGGSSATIISTLLNRSQPIRGIPPQELSGHIDPTVADEGSWLRAAHETKAMFLVSGRLREKADAIEAEIEVIKLLDRSRQTLPLLVRPKDQLDGLLLDIANSIAGVTAPGTRIEPATSDSQRSIDSLALYDMALEELYKNEWSGACLKLEQIVAEQPNFFEAWYHLAIASAWAAQPLEKTTTAVERAMELATTERDRRLMEVLNSYVRRDFLTAAPLAETLAAEYSRDPEIAYLHAEVVYHNGHYAQAVKLFDQAIRLAPRSHLATTHPLQLAEALGDEDAWQHYNRLRRGETRDSSAEAKPRPGLRFALGDYEALVKEDNVGYVIKSLAVLNRDEELDALLVERDSSAVSELALAYARALERGDEEAARLAFQRGMTTLRNTADKPGNHLRIREFFEVVIDAGRRNEIEEIFGYWELEGPMKASEQEAVYRAFAASALDDATWVASDGFTSWRQLMRSKALGLELEGQPEAAITLWRELLEDPSQWGDWLDKLALARLLHRIGRKGDLATLCAEMMRPTAFRPAFVRARTRCREWKALPKKRESSGAFPAVERRHRLGN